MTLAFGFLGLMVAVPLLAAAMVPVKLLYVEDVVGDQVMEDEEVGASAERARRRRRRVGRARSAPEKEGPAERRKETTPGAEGPTTGWASPYGGTDGGSGGR